MSFNAQTTHPDATFAFNGKTIHGRGPTQVTHDEAEYLRANALGVQVAEVEDGVSEPESEPMAEVSDERRQHELRERRGEYVPTYDHGHPNDPESDPYRERREIMHAHNPEHAAEQARHQVETRLATKNQHAHAPLLAEEEGESELRGEKPTEFPDEDLNDGAGIGQEPPSTPGDPEGLAKELAAEKPHRGTARTSAELDHPHSLQTDPEVKGLFDEESQQKLNPSGS